jgi:hypothetical protein
MIVSLHNCVARALVCFTSTHQVRGALPLLTSLDEPSKGACNQQWPAGSTALLLAAQPQQHTWQQDAAKEERPSPPQHTDSAALKRGTLAGIYWKKIRVNSLPVADVAALVCTGSGSEGGRGDEGEGDGPALQAAELGTEAARGPHQLVGVAACGGGLARAATTYGRPCVERGEAGPAPGEREAAVEQRKILPLQEPGLSQQLQPQPQPQPQLWARPPLQPPLQAGQQRWMRTVATRGQPLITAAVVACEQAAATVTNGSWPHTASDCLSYESKEGSGNSCPYLTSSASSSRASTASHDRPGCLLSTATSTSSGGGLLLSCVESLSKTASVAGSTRRCSTAGSCCAQVDIAPADRSGRSAAAAALRRTAMATATDSAWGRAVTVPGAYGARPATAGGSRGAGPGSIRGSGCWSQDPAAARPASATAAAPQPPVLVPTLTRLRREANGRL